MIHPLFIVGNKRSGTSHLVRVLNLHPQVFVSHESDIAWILYQFHRDQAFRAHAWDSDRGMRVTLATAQHLLRREASPLENFVAAQRALMESGSPWLPAQRKSRLLWIGDKKPMQHTDPELLAFVLRHFPTARFLHIVRHPFAVAASSDRFNRTANGDFWLGLSTHEKVERWTFHERQVLELRQAMPGRVHTLRYEDLCRRPQQELADVFRFLQLDPDPQVLREAAAQNRPAARAFPALRCSAATQSVAAAYGYDLPSRPTLRALTQNVFLRTARKLGA
jgi:hypothetical protein